MPTCPKCGISYSYAVTHVCKGRDLTKLWSLASVAIGGVVGGPLGLFYANVLIREACEKPDATNLCGVSDVPAIPFYIAIGAVLGASVAAFAVFMILRRRKA
jgi:hypothetical protein